MDRRPGQILEGHDLAEDSARLGYGMLRHSPNHETLRLANDDDDDVDVNDVDDVDYVDEYYDDDDGHVYSSAFNIFKQRGIRRPCHKYSDELQSIKLIIRLGRDTAFAKQASQMQGTV